MMAAIFGDLDELIGLVRRAARQEALEIEAAGVRDVQRMKQEADRAAGQVRSDIQADASRRLADEQRRQLAQATLAAQRALLTAREDLLEEVWVEAERQLRLLVDQPEYLGVLRRLALLAAQAIGHRPIILAADPHGHKLLTATELAAWSDAGQMQFMAAATPAEIWGGLMAWDEEKRRQVDHSFATRLALARVELRPQVARLLGML